MQSVRYNTEGDIMKYTRYNDSATKNAFRSEGVFSCLNTCVDCNFTFVQNFLEWSKDKCCNLSNSLGCSRFNRGGG